MRWDPPPVIRGTKDLNSGDHFQRRPSRNFWPEKKTLTWESLNYDVPTPAGKLRLLHDVYGYVRPGTLTALMGASGAGKTTCLDVLAQRKNIGVVTGDIQVDGGPLGSGFVRSTAYGLFKLLLASLALMQ